MDTLEPEPGEAFSPDADLIDDEPGDGFLRNLLVVLAVHVALIAVLWLVNRGNREVPPEQITWLDGSAFAGPPPPAPADAPPPGATETAVPEPERAIEPEPEQLPETPAPIPTAPAEPDALSTPAPKPTPVPKSTPEPTPAPKATPEPTPKPKPTPKPTATPKPKVAKSTPTPRPKPKAKPTPTVAKKDSPKPAEKSAPSLTPTPTRSATATTAATGNGTNAEGSDRSSTEQGSGRSGAPNGAAVAAERQTYYAAVGERFRVTWNLYKPLVGEGSGQELTARVHIKISPTGSVQQITLTRSTGNQEVDTSIERAFKDFKSVGAPPAILLQSGQFESDMAIILTI